MSLHDIYLRSPTHDTIPRTLLSLGSVDLLQGDYNLIISWPYLLFYFEAESDFVAQAEPGSHVTLSSVSHVLGL